MALVVGGIFYLCCIIIWINLGMKSDKIYGIVEFLSLHSKSISPMIYDLVLRGRSSKGVRFIALAGTGGVFAVLPTILVIALLSGKNHP